MKHTLKLVVLFALLFALVALSFACGIDTKTDDEKIPKVGLLTGTGGLGDNAFNDLCYNGTQMLSADQLKTDVVEPKDYTEMYGLVQQYADAADYLLTICVGYEYTQPLSELAALYPEQHFVLVDDAVGMDNVHSVSISPQENSFQIGAYAGWMVANGNLPNAQKKNKIGVVAAMDNELLRTFVTGYMCGAKYVNPDVEIMVGYVGSFADTQTAKELALNMYNSSCDIVWEAAGGSGLGVFEAAKEANLYAMGSDGYKNSIDGDHIIASSIRRLDLVLNQLILDAIDGKFVGGDHIYGAADSAVEISTKDSNVQSPDAVFNVVDAVTAKMASGEIVVPAAIEDVDTFIKTYGNYQ